MPPPKINLRDIRKVKIPKNKAYVMGSAKGAGKPQLLDLDSLALNLSGRNGLLSKPTTFANPTAIAKDTAVNGVATTAMRSDAAPAVQKTSSTLFGIAKVDGTTITAASGVISASASGLGVPVGANPTATAGPTAVNGSAATFLRSDGAPAVQTGTAGLLGLLQPDGTSILVSGGGIISVGPSAGGSVGQQFAASYLGWTPNAAGGSNLTLPVNGGSVILGVQVLAPMALDSLVFRNRDAANLHTLEWRLFQDVGTSTLSEVAGANGTYSFTPAGVDNRSGQVGSPPINLQPGIYWVVLRNTSATIAAIIGTDAVTGVIIPSPSYTKTLASGLTTTLSVASGFSRITTIPNMVLLGRAWGQSAAWPIT